MRVFTLIGELEYWNIGVMGEFILHKVKELNDY
jgi:hypothetical protein